MQEQYGINVFIMSKVKELSELSENIFENYLNKSHIEYKKKYEIDTGSDFDFFIMNNGVKVYCDVKIITKATDELLSREPAKKLIRDDIAKLRKKFGKLTPKHPCILISMNFAEQSISGYTVVDAMYGDSGITIAKYNSEKKSKPIRFIKRALHHVYRGNAKMREGHNTAISGILGFNASEENMSYLFHNEYAENQLVHKFFPETEDIFPKRESMEDIKHLTNISLLPHK